MNTTKNYSSYFKNKKHNLTDYDNEFIKWVDLVEFIVYSKFNLKLLDLTDHDYMMMFYDKYTPDQVALIVINDTHI